MNHKKVKASLENRRATRARPAIKAKRVLRDRIKATGKNQIVNDRKANPQADTTAPVEEIKDRQSACRKAVVATTEDRHRRVAPATITRRHVVECRLQRVVEAFHNHRVTMSRTVPHRGCATSRKIFRLSMAMINCVQEVPDPVYQISKLIPTVCSLVSTDLY